VIWLLFASIAKYHWPHRK